MRLARTLHRPFFEVAAWPHSEIVAQMAYDLACNDDFQAAFAQEQERARLAQMNDRQRQAAAAAEFKRIFKKD